MHQITFRKNKSLNKQSGFSLLESMIAIIVMVLGVLGMLGVQMRTLTDTQGSVRRAQALRLISDLSERLQNNPDALGNLAAYTTTPTSSSDCSTNACTPADLASYDIKRWQATVQSTLPGASATVFLPQNSSNQLGVLIGWNESRYLQNGQALNTDDANVLNKYLNTKISGTNSSGTAVNCPTGLVCHIQYIQPIQRCTPWSQGGGTLYCPN